MVVIKYIESIIGYCTYTFTTIMLTGILISRVNRVQNIKRMLNFTFKVCADKICCLPELKEQNLKRITDCICFISREINETKTLTNQKNNLIKLRELHYNFYSNETKEILKKYNVNLGLLFSIKLFFFF